MSVTDDGHTTAPVNSPRRLRLMLLTLVGLLVIVALTNWLIDPYGVWRISLIDRVYLRAEPSERIMIPYRVRIEQPATVLVGSSRVLWGVPTEQGYRDGMLNASLSGASLDELAAVIRVALRNPRLKRLVWGVDFLAFDAAWIGHDALLRRRLEPNVGLLITDTLLSAAALTASRQLLVRAVAGRERSARTQSVRLPWPQDVITRAFDDPSQASLSKEDDSNVKQQLAGFVGNYRAYRLSTDDLVLFRDTVARATAAGIDVILFIGPMSAYELEAIRQGGHWDGFQHWKRQLLATRPYWDFSGYTAYNDRLFRDALHYKAAVGHLILRHLLGADTSSCGRTARQIIDSGVWVDATTIDQHLARQDAARIAYTQRGSRSQELVAQVLGQ
jgi:hypothetical protein